MNDNDSWSHYMNDYDCNGVTIRMTMTVMEPLYE